MISDMKYSFLSLLAIFLLGSCHGDYWDLGMGYSFAAYTICKENERGVDMVIIDAMVIDFNYNDRYIVVFQNFSSEMLNNDTVLFGKEIKYYQQMKQQGRKYWVIDKYKDLVLGPFNKKTYNHITDSLGISELKLDTVKLTH